VFASVALKAISGAFAKFNSQEIPGCDPSGDGMLIADAGEGVFTRCIKAAGDRCLLIISWTVAVTGPPITLYHRSPPLHWSMLEWLIEIP
jgi:hypothetical protein